MRRAEGIDDLWVRTGQLWDEYSSLRRRHHELRRIWDDPDTPASKKERETWQWRAEWAALERKWRMRIQSFSVTETTDQLSEYRGLHRSWMELHQSSADRQREAAVERLLDFCDSPIKLREIHDSLEAYWQRNDMMPGKKINEQIDEAIRVYDRLPPIIPA